MWQSVAERQVLEGDNRVSAAGLGGVADRVLLGLLPSSEGGWGLGVACLKAQGGWMHVHGNVADGEEAAWTGRLEVRAYVSRDLRACARACPRARASLCERQRERMA